jgi:hypothetical protein
MDTPITFKAPYWQLYGITCYYSLIQFNFKGGINSEHQLAVRPSMVTPFKKGKSPYYLT